MTLNGWIQILFFFGVILACTKPIGAFMHRVMEGEKHFLSGPLGWLERIVLRLSGVDGKEQRWTTYSLAVLAFSFFTMLVTYAIQRLQAVLPFNPQKLAGVEASSSFNTAASFTTNTNWQGYVGEATMSYLSQMAGLAWHNFMSAAAGIAIAIALARGLTRYGDGKAEGTIGNFWVDLTRSTVYILLPLSVVFALVFVSQGMLQNLAPYREITTLEGARQVIAMGPVASQEAIKQLGTNGGGFFLPVRALVLHDPSGRVVASAPHQAGLEPIPAQVAAIDTLLTPGSSASALRRVPPLPPEGTRIAIVTHQRRVAWIDLWGDGAPATAASRRTLSDVGRILGTMLARSS